MKEGVKPTRILTDNDKEFVSRKVQACAKTNGITWMFGSPYHHQTTGAVERVNQTFWNKIRTLTKFVSASVGECYNESYFCS